MSDYTIDTVDAVMGVPVVPRHRVMGPFGRVYTTDSYPDAAFLQAILNSASDEQIRAALDAARKEMEHAA